MGRQLKALKLFPLFARNEAGITTKVILSFSEYQLMLKRIGRLEMNIKKLRIKYAEEVD